MPASPSCSSGPGKASARPERGEFVPMPTPVSILIPCHDAARWVGEAIESALRQTRPPGEVIVLDDGSNDESADIIASFGGRIRAAFRENRGGNPTRNELLASAAGQWIQFLDADDYLLPAKIETQLREAGTLDEVDVLYSPVLVDEGAGPGESKGAAAIDPSEDLATHWLRWQVCQTGAVLWRAEALRSIGGWNETMTCCQDNEVCLRSIQAGLRFRFCPTPGAVYRIWSEETVSRRDPSRLIGVKTGLIDEMLDWLRKTGRLAPVHLRAAGQACFEMARTLARDDLDAASAYYRQRKARGLIVPAGPAAPANYRLARRIAGFGGAERLARWLRR